MQRLRFAPAALLIAVACATPEPEAEPSPPPADGWYHQVRMLDVTGDGRLDSLDLQAHGPSSDSSVFRFRVIVDGKVAYTTTWSSDYELVDPPPQAATPAGRDSLIRASLDTTLARIRVRPIDASEWSRPWTASSSDCMDDPRNCLAMEFRLREARVNWAQLHRDSVASVYERVSRAPFDTAAVLQIARDMVRPGAVKFSLGYGYETTLELAWSPSAQEVFVIFSCC